MKLLIPKAVTITSSNVAASNKATWLVTTAYTIGQQVYNPTNYGEYEALGSSTGARPDLSPSSWKFLGTSNKYKMFDQFLNTQTTNAGSIVVTLAAYGSNGIYLGNLSATNVLIEVINNDTLAVIESFSKSMLPDVLDWLDYFYGDWIDNPQTSLTYERTTLTMNVSFVVTITNGTTAGCGIITCGTIKEIGATKWGLRLGALDYSKVTIEPSTGATYLEQGNYAKTLGVNIFTTTKNVPLVYKILTDARATPLVFISGGDEGLNVYGYIQKFDTLVAGPVETVITADCIGLI